MNEKVLLIGNPIAGYGHTESTIREFVQILKERGYRVETYITASAGDALRRAERIEQGVGTLVVAGGDGTLNEVINGLNDPSRIPIVLLPTGTSNVIAKELSLPSKPEAAAAILEKGEVRRIDMGLIDERRFLAFVSVGIDAMIAEELLRARKTVIGYRRYIRPVLKVLAHYHMPELMVSVDGGDVLEGGLVLVSNTRNYGGILRIADQAHCDSGHLDVCVFPKGTLAGFGRVYLAASRARVSRLEEVSYLTGRQIFIDSVEPVPVQIDGDYYGRTSVLINLRPSRVPMVVPSISLNQDWQHDQGAEQGETDADGK